MADKKELPAKGAYSLLRDTHDAFSETLLTAVMPLVAPRRPTLPVNALAGRLGCKGVCSWPAK